MYKSKEMFRILRLNWTEGKIKVSLSTIIILPKHKRTGIYLQGLNGLMFSTNDSMIITS